MYTGKFAVDNCLVAGARGFLTRPMGEMVVKWKDVCEGQGLRVQLHYVKFFDHARPRTAQPSWGQPTAAGKTVIYLKTN